MTEAGHLAPGDLGGPELPAGTELAPLNETESYGGARAPLSGFPGDLITGEC